MGFVACSSSGDDDATSNKNGFNDDGSFTKKLVEITTTYIINGEEQKGENTTEAFSYDINGKLRAYKYRGTLPIIWHNDSLTTKGSSIDTYSYYLKDNLIRNSTNHQASYTYNSDNKLIKITRQYQYAASIEVGTGKPSDISYYTSVQNFKWDGDRLTEVNDKNGDITLSYSGKTGKGINPVIFFDISSYGESWRIACLELFGLRSYQLPDGCIENTEYKKATYTFAYTFDSEGYVTKIAVQTTNQIDINGVPVTEQFTKEYKLTWE